MYPEPGQVLHFSEDSSIEHFVPRTIEGRPGPYVWAVDAHNAPSYWFPRDCPRAMAWTTPATASHDRARILGGRDRVHAIEDSWLTALRSVRLFAYRLPAPHFRPIGDPEPFALVSATAVAPLGPPEPVGDLLRLHERAGIQLRPLPSLWPFWDAVTASSLGFSGIRLRHARPRGTE
ncbi:DUF6886 family protein [Nocardia sp. NPDC050712]|uniref:DUF6886 family protein n=1 Tax=Nocardia sp. NPDC050712 TaxID=3155518 RepID=UPI0033E538C6